MKITEKQKLQAIEYKYYQNFKWQPKLNDYYILTRHSLGLELFQIVEETHTQFGIMKVWNENGGSQDQPTFFDKNGFTDQGFGVNRVYMPSFYLTNENKFTDSELLDWLQKMLTSKNDYCEIFFAGLRDGDNDATCFQIESNPEKFPTLNAINIRWAIKNAMNLTK